MSDVPKLRELWPHQASAIEQIREALRAGNRRIMVQMPTGSGKTLLAARIIASYRAKGKRAAFIAPYSTLIDQTIEVFEGEGLRPIGAMQADHPRTNPFAQIQVATPQTLARRDKPDADIIFVDEAHRLDSDLFEWLGRPEMQTVPVIGLSATPWSRGLGRHYEHLIIGATTASLIEAGHLSKFRIYAPSEPDLARVRTVAGEFNESDLGEAVDTPTLVANIVDTWLARAKGLPTLAFCVSRKHAAHVEQRFREARVASEYLDGQTTRVDREGIFARFRSGETKVIVNIDVLTAGFDADVRCLIDARPTKSEIRYVQMFGRGLRCAPGKDRLIVLDHSGNVQRLGLVTDIHHDALDDGTKRKAPAQKAERKKHEVALCDECKAILPRGKRICEACGFEKPVTTEVAELDGELVEIGTKAVEAAKTDRLGRAQFFAELRGHARRENARRRASGKPPFKAGWAAVLYKEKYGGWPGDFEKMFEEAEPTLKTQNWVKSRRIAFSRGRQNGTP